MCDTPIPYPLPYIIYMGSRIKFGLILKDRRSLNPSRFKSDFGIVTVFKFVEKDERYLIFQETSRSSLFGPLKIIWISKKQNASGGIRTREGWMEGLDSLHYAIKSLATIESNCLLMFFRTTATVIYSTIYGFARSYPGPPNHIPFMLHDYP